MISNLSFNISMYVFLTEADYFSDVIESNYLNASYLIFMYYIYESNKVFVLIEVLKQESLNRTTYKLYPNEVSVVSSHYLLVLLSFYFSLLCSIQLQNLGDMAMTELGEHCPLIREIVISHCRQITDVGLSHLVKSCTMLESCHMVYCSGITSAGVATVVSSCLNIKKVLVEKWKVTPRTKRRAGSVISYLCVDL